MKTDWFPHDSFPIRTGYYERDWTKTDILPRHERGIHLDWFEVDSDKRSICYPGIWYAETYYGAGDFNDASYQNLPWRGLDRDIFAQHDERVGNGKESI